MTMTSQANWNVSSDTLMTTIKTTVTENEKDMDDIRIIFICVGLVINVLILSVIALIMVRRGRKLNQKNSQFISEVTLYQRDSEEDLIVIFNGYKINFSVINRNYQVSSSNPSLHFESQRHIPSIKWENEQTKYMNYFVLLNKEKTSSIEFVSPRMLISKLFGKDKSFLPGDVELFESMCCLNESLDCTENKVEFKSSHQEFETMCAFLQDNSCQSDSFHRLKTVLNYASVDIVAKYFRTSGYKPKPQEECIVIPPSLNDLFIKKLDIYIIAHDTLEDESIHKKVIEIVRVSEEILKWEKKPRERFLKNMLEGTKTVFRARGMIVGCACSGKTTLLKRLKGEDIQNVESTKGVDIHNEIFRVNTTTGRLEIINKNPDDNEGKNKTLSITDFAGQCAYYACHQIYLSSKAFYILVTDMTKPLGMKVGSEQCQQDGTIFSDWTYQNYFEFWLRSLHVYCDNDTPVIVVATHQDEASLEISKQSLYDDHIDCLPLHADLKRHLHYTRYFTIGLNIQDDLESLRSCMFDLATKLPTWEERIPAKWEAFEYSVLKQDVKIMRKSELQSKDIFQKDIEDMLRYYHENGMILNFNEGSLADIIILDIQWFVDAFKLIITDENHVKQEARNRAEWQDFNKTGELNDKYLERLWKGTSSYIQNKDKLLDYMQRLGLIAKGSSSHYVPCMSKKDFDDHERQTLRQCSFKSSILVFKFDFLPYFIFCRLVVSCVCAGGAWKTILDEKNERKALYKNTAMFHFEESIVVLSVTNESILTQVFVRDRHKVSKTPFHSIRRSLIDMLKKITGTFHKNLQYEIGYCCKKEIVGEFNAEEMAFVPESTLMRTPDFDCPGHERSGSHKIYASDLIGHWYSNPFRRGKNWTNYLNCFARQENTEMTNINESGSVDADKNYRSNFEKFQESDGKPETQCWSIIAYLRKISIDAFRIYFDSKFSRDDLQKVLKTYEDEMRNGPYKFNEEQLLFLYPGDGSCPSSSNFDETIMYKLLRNYAEDLPEPSQGWGKKPNIGDTKETDDMERLRLYRNKFCHALPETCVMEKAFKMYWMDLSEAVLRISNGKLTEDVEKLEKQIGACEKRK